MAILLGILVGIVILVWQYIAIKKIKNWYVAAILPLFLICIVIGVAFHNNEKVDPSVILGILLISFGPYVPLGGL